MVRSSVFWQLFGGYAVVVGVFSLIVGLAVSDWVADESVGDIRDALRTKSLLLREIARPVLAGREDADFRDRVAMLGRDTGARLTVIDAGGRVLADSAQDPQQMGNHGDRPEFLQASREGEGTATRHSETVGGGMMYFARSVQPGPAAAPLGFVRAAISMRMVADRLAKLRGLVALGAGIAALVALLLGIFFARRITSRIGAVTSVAKAITGGDYSRRVLVDGRDEIGELAMAYNVMAENMQDRIDTITEDRNTVQGILRSMVEGVVAVDREEVVLHMNAVAGEMLHVDPAEVIGLRIWETARVNEIARSLSASLEGHRVQRSQCRIMQGDDECLLDISAAPLVDAEGELSGAVVVFHDVTEMRRLETVRREFVVNASHELKTPITAIRGFLDTMVEDPEMPKDLRRKFIQRAAAQADRLALLVTDLLRLSRFESAEDLESTERVDLRGVVTATLGQLGAAAAEKDITLEPELGDEPVTVLADPATVGLVVDNLVVNAIKYTPKGGRVQVRVRAADGLARLDVVDDGIGIDAADQDRIFERFYRVDKARSREVGGTGLGLAIAKHACGVLRGDLSVESEPGKGSTFSMRLPLADS